MSSILADQWCLRIWARIRGKGGGGFAASPPMSTAVHRSPNNFGDLTSYLTYDRTQAGLFTCLNLLLLVFADERRNTSRKGEIRSVDFFILIYSMTRFFSYTYGHCLKSLVKLTVKPFYGNCNFFSVPHENLQLYAYNYYSLIMEGDN